MKNSESLKITPSGDLELVIFRVFDAPREMIFEAFTQPAILKKWLLGPPGWTMPTCDLELKIGGQYRYLWRNETGEEMGVRGQFQEIIKSEKLIHTEKFDESWYPGESLITTILSEKLGKSLLTATIRYDSREARDLVIESNMDHGVRMSYDILEKILVELQH